MQVQRLTLSSSNFSPRSFSPTFLPVHHLTTKLSMSHPTSTSGFCSSLKWESKSAICLGKSRRLVEIRCGGLNEEGNDDGFYMRKCVELARRAIGCTSPNPMVGCVIVKDGKVVGEGFHPKAGQPHAEVFALRDAGDLAENATAYVSLEPCNHYGRTPPCTEALIKAKVKRVVVGMVDPNPIVASKGVARLKDAGIEVTVGVEEELCKWLNESFIRLMLAGKPFVTLRYSLSVNGHFVDHLGEGAAESCGYYSQLLQEHDAVILSSASIIDKFQIPASQEPGANQPLLIVMAYQHSSSIQISGAASAAAAKLVVFSDKEVKILPEVSKSSIETVVLEHVNLNAILEYCKRQGCCSVLLDLRNKTDDMEELLSQGIEKSLFQKLVFEVLPLWVEGENGNAPIVLKSLRETIEVRKLQAKISDKSFIFEGYL